MVAVLKPRLAVRPMKRRDLGAVIAIEQASYPQPWTRGIFRDCLLVGYRCRVLMAEKDVAGYAIVSGALDEAHLLNICIHPDHRRTGCARQLLDHVVVEARQAEARRLFLEVRPSNLGAIRLYRAFGFRAIGRRPGYYPDGPDGGREDATVMVLHLAD